MLQKNCVKIDAFLNNFSLFQWYLFQLLLFLSEKYQIVRIIFAANVETNLETSFSSIKVLLALGENKKQCVPGGIRNMVLVFFRREKF